MVMLARNLELPDPKITFVPPTEWLSRLRVLLNTYPQDDLVSTEALCCRVIGDFTAGIVLHRLLYWLPKGIRKDSAIWKSDRQWYAELNLSYAQMQRVRNRLTPVVRSWVEKAQGAPTFHYQLRIDALVMNIATVLNRSTIEIKLILLEKVENGFSEESRMDFRESRESITIQLQDNPIDERLKIFNPYLGRFTGFNPEIASKLSEQVARLGEDNTRGVLERCKASRGNTWSYVLRALENTSAPLRIPIPLFDAPTNQTAITDEMRQAWQTSEEGMAWAARIEGARLAPPAPRTASVATTATKHQSAWNMAVSQLEIQLDRASFDTWLRGAVFLNFEGGVFQIGVRNNYARDMLQHRLYRDIRRIVSDVLGEKVELVFEVRKDIDPEPEADELPLFKLMTLEQDASAAELTFYQTNFR